MRSSPVELGVNWEWLSVSLVPSIASSCPWWVKAEYSSDELDSPESCRVLSGRSSITCGRRWASNRAFSGVLFDLGEISPYAPSVAAIVAKQAEPQATAPHKINRQDPPLSRLKIVQPILTSWIKR